MTLQELYQSIGGDYEQALRVLRMDKLIDKHIRKLAQGGVVERLLDAGREMDPTQLFEAAHAAKGVCGNLGLVKLSEMASEIAEEYRPGHPRALSDDEVRARLERIADQYCQTAEGIRQYEQN